MLPWSVGLWGVGVLSVEAVASVGLALTCLLMPLSRPEWGKNLGQWARAWSPLLAFVGWGFAGPLLGGHLPTGTGVARLADWVAVSLAAPAWVSLGRRERRAVALAVGATFALSCALAGLQHLGAWPGPEHFESLRWTRLPFYRVYEPVPGAPGRYMAGGLLLHRLKFAHTGGLAVIAALALSLRSQGGERVACLSVAGLGMVAVLTFPYARAASAALLVALMVVLVLSFRRRALALALAAGVALTAAGLVAARPSLRDRFLSSSSAQGSGDRSFLLRSGLAAFQSAPLWGIGAGRFQIRAWAPPGTPDYVRENKGKAHNQFLTIAAETGAIGLLLFVASLLSLGLRIARGSFSTFGLGALVHFVLLSLAHDPLFQAPYSMALALGLSFATQEEEPVREENLERSEEPQLSAVRP
jgi:hypothetical protein